MIRYASIYDGIGVIHVVSQPHGCLDNAARFRDWPEKLLVDVDVLVGGTPCQVFSVSGKRRGRKTSKAIRTRPTSSSLIETQSRKKRR